MARWITFVLLAVVVGVCSLARTTVAGDPIFTYDATTTECVDLQPTAATEAVSALAGRSREGSVLPLELARDASTTPNLTFVATEAGPSFYRGAKLGEAPSFEPRPNDFKVDAASGTVKPTHGVSVFDNPGNVTSKGFVPHEVDLASVPPELQIIQLGADAAHYEIVPQVGANLTPEQYKGLMVRSCASHE